MPFGGSSADPWKTASRQAACKTTRGAALVAVFRVYANHGIPTGNAAHGIEDDTGRFLADSWIRRIGVVICPEALANALLDVGQNTHRPRTLRKDDLAQSPGGGHFLSREPKCFHRLLNILDRIVQSMALVGPPVHGAIESNHRSAYMQTHFA